MKPIIAISDSPDGELYKSGDILILSGCYGYTSNAIDPKTGHLLCVKSEDFRDARDVSKLEYGEND